EANGVSRASACNWRAKKSTRRATASEPAWPTTLRSFPPRTPSPAPTTTRSRRFIASTRLAPTSRAPSGRWKRPTRSEDTMSVEIEVGLENAANVKVPLPDPPRQQPSSKPLTGPKVHRALIIAGPVLLALVLGLYLYFHNRQSTHDSPMEGH